ncbi:hypothetical protein CPC08DRAFT_756316 [Agrocybe pediades]|nr:hypothetical protein CPC08DRAFT_756316 [Agrocybe pediades]
MMHDILRRSGQSALHVFAVLGHSPRDSGYTDFLDHVMSKHWTSIEVLYLHLEGVHHRDKFLPHLIRPSPSLRTCHIAIPVQDWWLRYWPKITIGLSRPLFENMAPNLRYLLCDHLAISTSAPWLSGLTTLITTKYTVFSNSLGVLETLKLLSGLSQLIYLELGHTIRNVVPEAAVSSLSSVHLPHLKTLLLKCSTENCLALLDRIQRPVDCLVNSDTVVVADAEWPDTKVTAERLYSQTVLPDIKAKYPKPFRARVIVDEKDGSLSRTIGGERLPVVPPAIERRAPAFVVAISLPVSPNYLRFPSGNTNDPLYYPTYSYLGGNELAPQRRGATIPVFLTGIVRTSSRRRCYDSSEDSPGKPLSGKQTSPEEH